VTAQRGKTSAKRKAKEAAPKIIFLKKAGTYLREAKKSRSFALNLCAEPRAASVKTVTLPWLYAHDSPYQLTL